MKIRIVCAFLIFLGISDILNAFVQDDLKPGTQVKLGVSQVNITPQTPTLMSGYSARKTPFTGVHDELFASALYFTNDKDKLLLITSDLIGYPSDYIDAIKKIISSKLRMPAANIMITAVHNHGGPVTKTYEKDTPPSVDEYVKVLQEKLVTLAVEASGNVTPVKMGTGTGTCSLNINRRALFSNGSIGLGRNIDGPCDHELKVTRFENMNGKTMAVLINWPCHGTASGQDNYQITGDWPGAAARYIKKEVGSDVVVAVTAGASADINPVYGPGSNFREIEAVGFHVATETVKVLAGITAYPLHSIDARYTSMTFPGKQRGKDNFPPATLEKGPDTEIRLTVLKIGNLVLAGVSGELMTEIGMHIKERSPYSNTLVVTHCNGSSGYICTDKAFKEGGYEIQTTRLMPGVEKPITDKFLDLITSL